MSTGRHVRIALSALVLLPLVSCSDDGSLTTIIDSLAMEAPRTVMVLETADSCDEVLAPGLQLHVEATNQGNDVLHVRIDDPALGACWVQPFDRKRNTLSWYGGVTQAPSSCNAGCTVQIESWLTLRYLPDGTLTGVETVRFTPLAPECADPACQFPCSVASGHPVLTDFDRRCAFACETTYSWQGTLGVAAPSACAP